MNITPREPQINLLKSSEMMRWVFPKALEGKVTEGFEELQRVLPADPKLGDVFVDDTEEFVRYVRKTNGKGAIKAVAYRCPQCKKTIIGPPKMTVQGGTVSKPSVDLIQPGGYKAKGNTGLYYVCSNCNAYLGSHPFEEHG